MSEEVDRVEDMLLAAAAAGEEYDPAGLLHELARLPEREARAALERLARERGVGAVSLLLKLASVGVAGPAIWATEALGTIRDIGAASALQVLASRSADGGVRKAARRGLHRLASLEIHPSVAAPAGEEKRGAAMPAPTSFASPIDGEGGRGVWCGFGREGDVDALGLVLNDEKGIVELVSAEMSRRRFDEQVSRLLGNEDLPWVEIPFDYCRHLVQEAHSLNAISGTPLPLEYLTWRDRIGRPEQEYPRPLVYSVLSSAEVRWDPRYLDRSDELFELEMFRMWVLDRQEMEEFVRERVMALQSGLLLAGASAETRDRLVVDRAVQRLFDLRRRALYKRRLEEMAYLLWKLTRVERAKMALAAALAMEPPDRPLVGHPFLRAMVEWSLEVVTAMVQGEQAKVVKPGVQLHLPY
jgi:hypothetical protein